jgi:ABC-type dipeptide/oligopeptide/nickel transport system permease component
MTSSRAGKIAWFAYAVIGTMLIFADSQARGEHTLGTLIVAAYCMPSFLLAALTTFLFTTHDPSPFLVWFLMVTLNGWLVFHSVCRFRKKKEPN